MLKAFTTSLIGSLPRSRELLQAKRQLQHGSLGKDEYEIILQKERLKAIKLQEETGIELITNGELERDNYVSFVAEKLDGVVMMSMGDMLDYIEDKSAFEQILNILDVPSISIKNAICAGKVASKSSLVADEMKELKTLTAKPIKATLPGPYLLTRSMWLQSLSSKYYKHKGELSNVVIAILKREIDLLKDGGVDVVQFDEPVLTEVVFTEGKTRSFMCAALSEKKDTGQELFFATHLLKEVVSYAKEKHLISSLHICRGNWSKNESILLSGPYTPLLDLFEQVSPDILALEFSTPRAGELSSLLENKHISKNIVLGLGCINPRSDEVEKKESIMERVDEALKWLRPEQIWLNPDCGFATFANRPVNDYQIIGAKLRSLNEAKLFLREKYGC